MYLHFKTRLRHPEIFKQAKPNKAVCVLARFERVPHISRRQVGLSILIELRFRCRRTIYTASHVPVGCRLRYARTTENNCKDIAS